MESELQNGRRTHRQPARRSARVTCYIGPSGSATITADGMRDLSEAGVCLLLAEPLEVGLAVEIQLDGIPHRQAVKIPGKVVWLNPTSDGRFLIGLQFDTLLPRMDLLAMARV